MTKRKMRDEKANSAGDGREIWNRRWEGFESEEKITLIGKFMFQAKKRAILQVLGRYREISSVLEAGCGLGYTLRILRDAGYRCRGIDSAENAVNACRRQGLTADLMKVEDVAEVFDLVSSDGMLEHFLNFEPVARHLMRISRKYVLLIQPNHDSFLGKTAAYLAELIRKDAIVFEYNYRISDFIDVFERGGFVLECSKPIFGDVFRLLFFSRK